MAWGTLVTNLGSGAWYATWAIFLTTSVGLTTAQLGIGMLLGGVAGAALGIPVGRAADRRGPRDLYVLIAAAQGGAAMAYILVGGFASFLLVTCVALTLDNAKGGPFNALICGLTSGAGRIRTLATMRVMNHVGVAFGAVAGAAVIAIGTRPAYVALLVLNGVTYLIYAAAVRSVPAVPPLPRPTTDGSARLLRDRPYLSLAAICGVLTLCWGMLSSAVPLWVAQHTEAPRAIAAAVVLVNAVAIALLQVRVARHVTSPGAAARAALWSGVALAGSCLLFASASGLPAGAAAAVLLAGGAVHVAGELLYVAAAWGLSVGLMPEDARGEYQGAFATAKATAVTAAPVIMTAGVVANGRAGWAALACVFVAATAPTGAVVRWALRTRPATA